MQCNLNVPVADTSNIASRCAPLKRTAHIFHAQSSFLRTTQKISTHLGHRTIVSPAPLPPPCKDLCNFLHKLEESLGQITDCMLQLQQAPVRPSHARSTHPPDLPMQGWSSCAAATSTAGRAFRSLALLTSRVLWLDLSSAQRHLRQRVLTIDLPSPMHKKCNVSACDAGPHVCWSQPMFKNTKVTTSLLLLVPLAAPIFTLSTQSRQPPQAPPTPRQRLHCKS